MPNLVEVTYEQTGESTNTDEMGIRLRLASAGQVREMQARVYAARDAQHLYRPLSVDRV
jgi:hypothetical protein